MLVVGSKARSQYVRAYSPSPTQRSGMCFSLLTRGRAMLSVKSSQYSSYNNNIAQPNVLGKTPPTSGGRDSNHGNSPACSPSLQLIYMCCCIVWFSPGAAQLVLKWPTTLSRNPPYPRLTRGAPVRERALIVTGRSYPMLCSRMVLFCLL